MLARYTAWILGLMKVLGIWGPFVIAFADSALLGMPVDFIVATYVYWQPRRILLYISMASLGSALGSIPLYIVGDLGEREVASQANIRRALSADSCFLRAPPVLGAHVRECCRRPLRSKSLCSPQPYSKCAFATSWWQFFWEDFYVLACCQSWCFGLDPGSSNFSAGS